MPLTRTRIGNFDLDLLKDFFRAFAVNAELTLHLNMHYGENLHHIAEATFKAVARALAEATRLNPRDRRRAVDQGEPLGGAVIAVVDYGRGNLGSVEKAFARLGCPRPVTEDPRVVADAEAVVLPGDGAFHDAMDSLCAPRAGRAAPAACIDEGRPFLGICLGYQLLFTESEEFGHGKGLDVIPGAVRRFPPRAEGPAHGLEPGRARAATAALFDGVPSGAYFYFVHSYYPETADALRARGHVRLRASTFPAAVEPRRAVRHPVPPREEPALGPAAARELRGGRPRPPAAAA